MGELSEVLRIHAMRYPVMEPCDAVKLVFQNEFGGGHMIANCRESLARIKRETESAAKDPILPITESIGNGIARLNLAAIDTGKISLTDINRIFIKSSNEISGSITGFCKKAEELIAVAGEGAFLFTAAELEKYLYEYKIKGYPAVSHSESYRKAYRPAYRVVKEIYCMHI